MPRVGGTVSFFTSGKPVKACAKERLKKTLTALCRLPQQRSGEHQVTASYSGDGNFVASTSRKVTIRVQHLGARGSSALTIDSSSARAAGYERDGDTTIALVDVPTRSLASARRSLTLGLRDGAAPASMPKASDDPSARIAIRSETT